MFSIGLLPSIFCTKKLKNKQCCHVLFHLKLLFPDCSNGYSKICQPLELLFAYEKHMMNDHGNLKMLKKLSLLLFFNVGSPCELASFSTI